MPAARRWLANVATGDVLQRGGAGEGRAGERTNVKAAETGMERDAGRMIHVKGISRTTTPPVAALARSWMLIAAVLSEMCFECFANTGVNAPLLHIPGLVAFDRVGGRSRSEVDMQIRWGRIVVEGLLTDTADLATLKVLKTLKPGS